MNAFKDFHKVKNLHFDLLKLKQGLNEVLKIKNYDIENVAKHLPADGSAWITNNTKYHNAFNGGEENRVHLVACLTDYKFN